jgi:hypothetical protein
MVPIAVCVIVASGGIKIGYECGRRDGREEMKMIALDSGHAEQHSDSYSHW